MDLKLEDLLSMDGLAIEMSNTDFLETYTRGELGVSVYTAEYKASIDGKSLVEGKLIGMVTAKKYGDDGIWKIGNYSIINVRDKENFKEVFGQ